MIPDSLKYKGRYREKKFVLRLSTEDKCKNGSPFYDIKAPRVSQHNCVM